MMIPIDVQSAEDIRPVSAIANEHVINVTKRYNGSLHAAAATVACTMSLHWADIKSRQQAERTLTRIVARRVWIFIGGFSLRKHTFPPILPADPLLAVSLSRSHCQGCAG